MGGWKITIGIFTIEVLVEGLLPKAPGIGPASATVVSPEFKLDHEKFTKEYLLYNILKYAQKLKKHGNNSQRVHKMNKFIKKLEEMYGETITHKDDMRKLKKEIMEKEPELAEEIKTKSDDIKLAKEISQIT